MYFPLHEDHHYRIGISRGLLPHSRIFYALPVLAFQAAEHMRAFSVYRELVESDPLDSYYCYDGTRENKLGLVLVAIVCSLHSRQDFAGTCPAHATR